MTIARHFLGWDAPVLPRAVAWLRDRYGMDMSGVTVVTPGSRAGRRLLELLVESVEGAALCPPERLTVGGLPERLYDASDAADDMTSLLAWVGVLRDADDGTVMQLTPQRPAYDDALGWVDLAEELMSLREQLAAEGLSAEVAAGHGPERWQAVAALEQAYERRMRAAGRIDRHAARREALDARQGEAPVEPRGRGDGEMILLGTVQLPAIARRMLARHTAPVHALVIAPADEADAFEDDGTLRIEAWSDRGLEVDDDRLLTVDRPTDQALAALGAMTRAVGEGEFGADDVTIGLGDETLGPTVQRVLDEAGVPTRLVGGRPVSRSRPARLLSAAARYLRTRRWSDFAEWLRHPDLETWLMQMRPGAALDEGEHPSVGGVLSLLDRYLTDHLQGRSTAGWLGEDGPRVKAVHDAVLGLLSEQPTRRRPVADWADPIAGVLAQVYEGVELNHFNDADIALIHALGAIGEAIETLRRADDPSFTVTAADAMDLLLSRVIGQSIPPVGGQSAVELLGFLELPLDDAPIAIVTGVNEGSLPSGITGDPLLPGSLRERLGLPGNRSRYARDLYAMTVVLRSRLGTVLITGRRGADDEPLRPSRLLLATDEHVMASRLEVFYREDSGEAMPVATPLQPGRRDATQLFVPPPRPLDKPITKLRVTAFRDYLACPYRFYLKHVLRLEAVDDRAVEMDGGQFGTLAHRVLRAFGEAGELHAQTRAAPIAAFLDERLTLEARAMFGGESSAAVILQIEQLRQRLEAFARWQARSTAAGWRILPEHVEQRREAVLNVDGRPFTITGQIDRVDVHDEHGHRILDYKSRDAAEPPDKVHRKGRGDGARWVDLQLPLYRHLAAAGGIDGAVELGYVLLPRKVEEVDYYPAPWDESQLAEAENIAMEVIRAIRDEAFWPPRESPPFADGLEWICYDDIADRGAAIKT